MSTSENLANTESLVITARNQIKRLPQRGQYDRPVIHQILDEGLVCHLGFSVVSGASPQETGQPFVIPTAYGRVGDFLYIHGSPASRMLQSLQGGLEVCVTVTLLDGLVLARSAFHHSMNYRSVVIFGTATVVKDFEQKVEALRAFTEHVVPKRWAEVRQPTRQEILGTLVLALPLAEASAKIRTGGPIDDEADYALPVWAGVIPLALTAGIPLSDTRLPADIPLSDSVQHYTRTQESR
jgi:uncharacterized protein